MFQTGSMMTQVNIDLWVLLVGVALPSTCLLLVSLVYCWRRFSRRRSRSTRQTADVNFNQRVLLEMILQQTDTAFNALVDAIQAQRVQLLQVLETQQLPLPPETSAASLPNGPAGPPLDAPQGAQLPNGEGHPTGRQASGTADDTLLDGTAVSSALFDPYAQIPGCIREGLSIPEVAARLNLPESAVDLYVNLRMPDHKSGSQRTA